ncbi:MAG: T9SS type A sorting domain-containing protein [Saprospiraceae bacterium]|uniref:T9SS type A sorting domain-containing protein n=1 Tax=Candidatus Opimibacter skivensis TaxID=2982028 RepID=A0A9D7XUD8_9BACT|nr:T9SS type A sorting domain-containing protein [Candidatus Opimibacter skivensis]
MEFRYRYIWLVCLFLMPMTFFAQSGYKKILSYTDSRSLNIDDIIFHNDHLFLSGNAYTLGADHWGHSLAELDTNGVVIWQKTYFDTSSTTNLIANSPCRFYFDGKRILALDYIFERNNLNLVITDSVGNVLEQGEFINSESSIFPQIILTYQKGIYLFGTIARNNYFTDCYMIKADSLGQFQWIKYFGSSNYNDEPKEAIDNKDGTFIISATKYNNDYNIEPFGSHGWRRPWIFTVDTSGTIISQWIGEENDPRTLGYGPLYHLKDSGWIVISSEYKSITLLGNEYTAQAPTITRLDSNYNLVWKKYMSDYKGYWDRLEDMEYDSLRDEFVAAGHRTIFYSDTTAELESWVVKFKADGEILWSNSDSIWYDRTSSLTAWTSGLAIAPSGSIYVAGRLDHDNFPHREFGWLLKVSTDGCFTKLCQTASDKDIPAVDAFKIYPNPVHDYFEVEKPDRYSGSKLIIWDLYGRIVEKADLTESTTKIDCKLPTGIYFYTIFENNIILKSGKLIVV